MEAKRTPYGPLVGACCLLAALAAAGPARADPEAAGAALTADVDPLAQSCPGLLARKAPYAGFDAWNRADRLQHVEGDGPFGMDFGHTVAAIPWFCRAVASGHARAAFDLARIFEDGYGVNTRSPGGIQTRNVAPDRALAVAWYQWAARAGYAEGDVALALYRIRGPQVIRNSPLPKDVNGGIALLNRAGEAGDTRAQLMLASLYAPGMEGGSPVPKDRGIALKWLLQARALLAAHRHECTEPERVDLMVAQLPDPSIDRQAVLADIEAVHGEGEWVCLLHLSRQAASRNQPGGLMTLFAGGALDTWAYEVSAVPGTAQRLIRRETAAQAVTRASGSNPDLVGELERTLQAPPIGTR